MEKSWMPTVAGVVCIVTGSCALLGFVVLAAFCLLFFAIPDVELDELPRVIIQAGFAIAAIGTLTLGLLAIFGGISCTQRRRWGWCLAGAISTTLICVPLGVAAIILIVLSEREIRGQIDGR